MLLDALLVLPNPTVWKRQGSYQGILSFVKQLDSSVPATAALFAAPEVKNPVLIVIAYRLDRNILRKPMACAEANDYFLTPADAAGLSGAGRKVLAAAEKINVALSVALAPQGKTCAPENPKLREDDQADSTDSD